MSAETSRDVSLIQDEDVLRKMWQDTEDFGRKKEIRSHMYKLREARLRDFYNSGEVSSEIKRTTTSTTESKCSTPTHADSLADHSFISMKTKEIRDSESPTRDVSYRVTAPTNQGWTITSSNQKSEDGKTFTTSKLATTSGTEKIPGGKVDYAAKNEQQASVYQDGDDKNFTKAIGAASSTFIKQEASGGDANSSFKSSSTKTSSSSKYVSESRSNSGDIIECQPSKMITQNQNDEYLVSKKTYTDNIPNELKNHPGYVDGKTKVTRETRTLPDGTTVTTTRYEVKGGSSTQSAKSSHHSTTQQSSSTQQQSTSQAIESRTSQNESKTIHISGTEPSSTKIITRQIQEELQPATTRIVSKTVKGQSLDTVDDSKTTVIKSTEPKTTTVVRKVYDIVEPSTTTSKTTVIKNTDHINQESNIIKDAKVTTQSTVIKNVCDVNREYLDDSRSTNIKTTLIKDQPRQIDDTQAVTSTIKTTVTKQINDTKDVKKHAEDSLTKINEKFIRVEQQDTGIRMVQSPEKTVPKATSPEKQTPRATSPEKPAPRATSPEKPSYEMPERRQPIKPGKSELDNKSKPTEGQYDTTYRSDYTNKKISVEVSPTHDAFARSLRSVSPDRITKCSTPRTSTHSLRSSISPEKNRHPSRLSPERRSVSPRKTTSHETITYRTGTNTDTITRRNKTTEIDSSTLTRRKKKTRSRSPSPTSIASDIEFFRNSNIVTDLDTNETTIISSRPSSLDVTKKTTRKITDRSSTSPLTDTSKEVPRRGSLRNVSPTKESPHIKSDRPFKRTDTYEERCRQILGITAETSKRKSSLEKITNTRRTSASKISPEKIITTRRSPEKKFKEFPSETRKSPEKSPTKSPIKEFPSQIRKSPEKEPLGEYPEKKRPKKTAPQISEFPSQIRRTPEKEPLGEYPEKRKPVKETPTISEFPSQIRRSPEKEPLEKYPEKAKPAKESPRLSEFPSQIRKSPEKEPLGEYPEKKRPEKEAPQICEFPSQIRRTPEKEPWEKYPEKEKPSTEAPKIREFPSQIRKSPEKQPLGEYPEKKRPEKEAPLICEFPSQIRRTPEKEPLEKYPEKEKPRQEAPKISEFPSQIRRSPEKEPLGEYPEKQHPEKKAPGISEFPSQIRRTPEKEPLAKYPEKERPKQEGPEISDFPSQTRQSPERKPNKEVTCEYPSEKDTPKFTETPLIKVSPTKKHPKKTSPKDKSRKRTESSSSSSTDEETNDREETNIEEINTFTKISDLEGKIPVDEPLVTKRFIAQLGKDEEMQRTDLTKKKTQTLLNKEIQKTEDLTTHKTVKKDLSRKSQNDFIEKERIDTITKCTPRATSPIKKPLTEKNNITVTSKKLSGTKKTVTNEQAKAKDVKRTTLYDIENMNNTREDSRIHIRTHRIDDTINKKVTKTTVNGDITRKSPTKRPQPSKPEEPKTKKIIEKRPSQKTISKTTTTITTEQKTPRRHIVSTTITVSPKTRPSPARSPTKSVTSKTTTVTKTSLTAKKAKLQNGHVSSEDESVVDSVEDLSEISTTVKKQKESITRLSTKKPESKSPTKGGTKPEGLSSKVKQEKKCITTKSIIINNETTGREVVVDLQRSKSSREPTPDRICPLPVTSDDESTPRYPDQIAEPDDITPRHKPKRLSDIPLTEGEDVQNFNRITEIEDVVSVDRVEKTDESLLSVNKKIDKFLDSERVTKTREPAPKIERPKFEIDEDLKSDECLLSVSEKVNKFITTAEQLTAPQEFPQRPKSPKCQYYPEEDVSVSDKVAHFITTAEKVVTTQKTSPKVGRPNLDEVDETIKNDECLLSVSEKVSKFINTAEQLTTDSKKSVSLSKIDTKETSPSRRSKETTPTRKPSNQYSSIKTEPKDSKYPRRDTSPKLADTTPKSTRRPSEEEPRSVLSPTGRLRSTESVRKAKALFENINKEQIPKQRDILSRPSVFEGRRLKSEASRKLEYETREDEEKTLKSTKLIMDKVRPRSKSPEKEQYVTRRSQSPDGDVPGYMKPLDRSLRPNSPHRESINQLNKKYISVIDDEESTDVRQTKFGVTLKRTDSGRAVTTTSHTAKSRVTVEGVTEEEIEEIYELEILEQLLEKVTDYELRRKIRTQIRLVKKLVSEGKLTEVANRKITIRGTSPEKITKQASETIQKTTTEYKSYSYDERRSSKECTKEIRRSKSPETKATRSRSPPKKTSSSYEERRTSTEYTKETRRSQSPDTKPATKIFNTQLKRTSPSSKPTVEDNRPEWAKQRHLKKPSESTTTMKTTKTVTKTSRTSPVKDTKATDAITSSYGVGPTDENGTPLFGLKALRSRNKTDTTKVQGTVIRSQYYSENGEEPIGEISVTKYSSDPRDLGRNEEKRKGITSITTTQKFGYKDTPSLKSLTSSKNKKEIEEEQESKTTKVSRRGSVKALSQKFIENAVETSKNERQSSYPKAGLILRTSSFKDSASSGESREGSAERTLTVKTSKTVSGETFLSSSSKITGVQDVISRMKNEEVREGDSMEDVEARGLLNKFIGSQVILSGLESNVKSTNSKRTTKITTTLTEGGKPTTKTRIFHHPISDEELESIWDEQTLRLLLEQSTDYEERRKIRARLRQVMAEQEACTELVEKASQDQTATTFDGESQLLPLLQGLLEAPDTEQTADSGTESGEDQRNGLIAEVQNALDKLSASLRDDAADLTPDRRSSLLQLVTKLQAGLAASVPQERRSSVQGRFRRRQRPNRHTVGVSSEELADARRLIQEISLHDFTPTQSRVSLLQKQNSEGCVGQHSSSSFKNFSPQKTMVKNAIAKPFSSSNSTVSGTSSSVQTPTEASECLDLLFNEESEKKPDFSYRSISMDDEKIRRSSSGDVSLKSVHQAVQQAAAIKVLTKSTENLMESEETDEDTTVKALSTKYDDKKELPQPDIIMQNNPIYNQQDKSNEDNNNFAYHQAKNTLTEDRINKFSTKKLKMRRANTIDIPKPLNFYEENDSDCSLPEEDYNQRRRSNYLALRGPIRLGNPSNKNTVPTFEPKTDNDKKFLAFINKHNESNSSKNSLWAKPEDNKGNIWSNKFGNIKTAFERASATPVQSQNTARQFWKSADDAVTSGPKYDGPKISKQSARNLREMFEEKQKQAQKVPWSGTQNDKNIVTGSLKVKAFEPSNDKTYKFVPQPLPVNKFSHAPQSAFKPLPKKTPPAIHIPKTVVKSEVKEKDLDSPLYLYSPKPPNEPSLKPWATSPGESRVLSLAASKFENIPQQEVAPVKPRKLSKDKVVLPFQQHAPEKLTAPYLVKTLEQKNSNTVKQLSGQYDNQSGRRNNDAYSTFSTVKYTAPQVEKSNYQHQLPPHYNVQNQYSSPSQQYYPQNQHYGYQVPQSHQYDYQNQQNRYMGASNQQYPHQNQYNQHYEPHRRPQQDHENERYKSTNTPTQHYLHQNHYNQDYEPQRPIYNNVTGKYPPNAHYVAQNYHNQQENSERPRPQSSKPHNEQNHHQSQDYYNEPHQYTSTYQYQPQIQTPSPQPQGQKEKSGNIEVKPPKLDSQVSVESLKEYNAVNVRVMTGPVCQQATTIRQKSPMNRDQHDIAAALNLKNSLQKAKNRAEVSPQKEEERKIIPNREESHKVISPSSCNYENRQEPQSRVSSSSSSSTYGYREEPRHINSPSSDYNYKNKEEPVTFTSSINNNVRAREEPKRIVSPSSFSYKPREAAPKPVSPHSFSYRTKEGVQTGYRKESLEINDNGESIVTSRFQIPVINVPQPESPRPPSQAQIMSKADSWNQICLQNQPPLHKPSPRASPNARTISKSKSSHTLALPKQFEAGMSKEEMALKRKTMEAFLGGGGISKSPQPNDTKVVKRSINRVKTSEKVSTCRQSSGLSRSRTLPDICPELLDESNVDKAFEDLFKSNS